MLIKTRKTSKDKSKQGFTNHNLFKRFEIPKPSHGVRKLGSIMVEQDKYHTLLIRDN